MQLAGNPKGLSLTELLGAIIILAIILAPMYNALQVAIRGWKFEEARSEVIQNARIAMERMTHEIREAREIYSATDKSIYFWWKDDLNNNNPDVADDNEKITYSWSGNPGEDLTRRDDTMVSGEEEPLANYVEVFSIEYRKKDGTILATPVDQAELSNIYLITINLTIKNKGHSTTLRASLRPRNM